MYVYLSVTYICVEDCKIHATRVDLFTYFRKLFYV